MKSIAAKKTQLGQFERVTTENVHVDKTESDFRALSAEELHQIGGGTVSSGSLA